MPRDLRTPVLIGVGATSQTGDDPADLDEAVVLMQRAVEQAADDAGSRALLPLIDLVLVPNGTWGYRDPGRTIADHLGATPRTVVAEIGVLQQSMLSRAAATIAAGDADVVLVCGGEAKHRALQAARAGQPASEQAEPDDAAPDELVVPTGDILTATEIERDLAVPAHQYALIDNALAAADGIGVTDHRRRLGELWASFARVAATNPDAWDRGAPTADVIAQPSPANRMVASPYTKLLCSQWNVDQAGALLLTSVATAQRLGLDPERAVFPHVGAESNLMVPLPQRGAIERCEAFAACADALFGADAPDGCTSVDDVSHLDLYSCFPAAVQVQARELGLALDDPRGLTVTGGMTFAGGPLNNYVIQAMVTMARRLRGDPGSFGLVTSVSGMLTKVGAGLWSTSEPTTTFRSIDVTEAARGTTRSLPLDPDLTGAATAVGHTVVHGRDVPARGVAVVERDGVRSIAVTDDAATVDAMSGDGWSGQSVEVTEPGRFRST